MVHNADYAQSQLHHIATYFGEYGQKFEAIFRQAGITGKSTKEVLGYAKNLVELVGHRGRHTKTYHEFVYDYLKTEVGNKVGTNARDALDKALEFLREELTKNPRLPYQ